MFFLLKTKIQPYLSLIKVVISGAVLLVILSLGFMNHQYKDEISAYKANEKIVAQLEATHKANLEAQKAQIERDWAKQRIEANEKYNAEIQRIHNLHADRLRDLGRVQYSAKEIIKYLPDYTRPALEKVAITTTDSAIECSAILTEVEAVARGYSAEIDELIFMFPRNPEQNGDKGADIPQSKEAEVPKVKPQPKPYLD